MAQTDPLAAEKFISDASGRLKAEDRMALSRALNTPILQAKAERNYAGWASGNRGGQTPESKGGGDPTRGMGGFALIDHGPTEIAACSVPACRARCQRLNRPHHSNIKEGSIAAPSA